MTYCAETDLQDYLLPAYLTRIEQTHAGSIAKTLGNVSAIINEAVMAGGWAIPDGVETSALLTEICAVMTCWRLVGKITSLMDTGAISDNEWFPLQKLNARAEKDLVLIRGGKLDPFPAEEGAGGTGGIEIHSLDRIFTRERLEMF